MRDHAIAGAFLLVGALAAVTRTNNAQAPAAGDHGDSAFAAAARKHRYELNDLMLARGMPHRAPESTVTAARVTAMLADKYATYGVGAVGLAFYSFEHDTLGIWLLDAGGIRAYSRRAVTTAQLDSAVGILRDALGIDAGQRARLPTKRGFGVRRRTPARPPLPEAIDRLTDLLLPEAIAGMLGPVRHLIVVPARDIGTVPFALLRPPALGADLIDRMSVSIAPSLFDVEQDVPEWEGWFIGPTGGSALVVGNPASATAGPWLLPSLPGAEREAREVARRLGVAPLLGTHATKDTVLERAGAADILYFATHGVADGDDPLAGGFLALAPHGGADGFWTAREIQNSRLQARLVVLSACQTGLGRTHDAGIIGLARAFQLAGVPRVVMSLWSVDDEATAELMRLFVARLERESPNNALQNAMLDLRKTRPDPALWAPFVLFGSPN